MTKLRPKMQKFVIEYVKDMNGSQAAIRAGYPKKTATVVASQMLKLPKVREAVDALLKQEAEQTGITISYVLAGLKEVAERCLQRKPVMVRVRDHMEQATNEDGEGVWTFDSNGANKALELLGKYKAMFNDQKPEQGNTVNIHYVKYRPISGHNKNL